MYGALELVSWGETQPTAQCVHDAPMDIDWTWAAH